MHRHAGARRLWQRGLATGQDAVRGVLPASAIGGGDGGAAAQPVRQRARVGPLRPTAMPGLALIPA
jgi:hypothetical protein